MGRSGRIGSALMALAIVGAALAVPDGARANGCSLRLAQGVAGTTADPIRIATAADLAALGASASCYAGDYAFAQTADIALSGVFTPIGTSAAPFDGDYDGRGHAISGLYIDQSAAASYKGLFGVIRDGAVRSLVIRDAAIIGTSYYYGVLAGDARPGALIEDVAILDSSVASTGTDSEYMGGVVGGLRGGTIRDAHVRGMSVAIAAENDYIGGIAGFVGSGAIERSSADVSITGAGSYAGGVAGIIYGAGTITDSYARGSVSGRYRVGGLLGAFYGGGGPITRAYSTTRVEAAGSATSGGLVGDVMATPAAPDAVVAFWDTQTSEQATSANAALGRTTAAMRALATFADAGWSIAAGWDAARTWGLCANANDGYPLLTGAYTAATEPCSDRSGGVTPTPDGKEPSGGSATVPSVRIGNARVQGNVIRSRATVSGAGGLLQTGGVLPVERGRVGPEPEHAERAGRPGGPRTIMVACRARAAVRAARTVDLACRLNARARRLLTRRAVVVRLVTTFRPVGGAAVRTSTLVALPQRTTRPASVTTS
jgi:hypothetical protein